MSDKTTETYVIRIEFARRPDFEAALAVVEESIQTGTISTETRGLHRERQNELTPQNPTIRVRPTLWQRNLCRWRSYHTWHDGRCIVCGTGMYG